jgi:hypothetical protein
MVNGEHCHSSLLLPRQPNRWYCYYYYQNFRDVIVSTLDFSDIVPNYSKKIVSVVTWVWKDTAV